MTTEEAIDFFGSARDLALAINTWPQTVYLWKEYPPVPQQYVIYYKSNQQLLPEDLKNEKSQSASA